MRDTAFVVVLAAVLCVTFGMGWGIQMGISGDHTMAGAHAHLNLAGWATLALFGVYYRLTPQAAQAWLARAHLAVALPGIALMIGGLAWVFTGGPVGPAIAGSLLTAASMLIFLFTVIRHGFGPRQAAGQGTAREMWLGTPA
ncbi:MAG TPA: hypothetical protein VM899_08105 [Rubellimicrobium sp.]|nr:hypothetical protein [Rubellimicrobium sp.]